MGFVWVISANKIAEPLALLIYQLAKTSEREKRWLSYMLEVTKKMVTSILIITPWIKNAMRFPVPFFKFR